MSGQNSNQFSTYSFRQKIISDTQDSGLHATFASIYNQSTRLTVDKFIEKIKKESAAQKHWISCDGSTLQTIAKVCQVTIYVFVIVDLIQEIYETRKFQAKHLYRKLTIFLLYDAKSQHFDALDMIDGTGTKIRCENNCEIDDLKPMFDQFIKNYSKNKKPVKPAEAVDNGIDLDMNEKHEMDKRMCRPEEIFPKKRSRANHSTHGDRSDSLSRKILRSTPSVSRTSALNCSSESHQLSETTGVPSSADLENILQLSFEPAQEFRGRMRSEFKPVKSIKRNGTSAHARHPVYFADVNNKHELTLLIPRKSFQNPRSAIFLELCIITNMIHGCVYIHPKFKFQINDTDFNSPDLNPRFLFLQLNENEGTDENNRFIFKLHLVVIMLTRNQLIENQPFELFQGKISNQTPLSTKGLKVDELEQKFQLDSIRFAFTPWPWIPESNVYCRSIEHQYISQVSRQDRTHKVKELK